MTIQAGLFCPVFRVVTDKRVYAEAAGNVPPQSPVVRRRPRKTKTKKPRGTTGVGLPVPDPAVENLSSAREPRTRRTKNRQDNDDGFVLPQFVITSLSISQHAAANRAVQAC